MYFLNSKRINLKTTPLLLLISDLSVAKMSLGAITHSQYFSPKRDIWNYSFWSAPEDCFHIICYLYGWYVLKLRLPCREADFPTHCLKYCVYFFQLGGCTTIPESDLEERSIEQDSTEPFTNHKHLIAETPMPGKKMGGLHQWYVRGSGTSGQFLSYQRTFCKAAYFLTSPSLPSTLVQLNLIICVFFSILKPLSLSHSLSRFLFSRYFTPPRSLGIVQVESGWGEDGLPCVDLMPSTDVGLVQVLHPSHLLGDDTM